MNLKSRYLLLCVLGTVIPYSQFIPWAIEHGLNIRFFIQQLFANRIGGFFGMDVLISALALLMFSRVEGARIGVRGRWLPLIAVLTVGVSLGLPLFLYLRERRLEEMGAARAVSA